MPVTMMMDYQIHQIGGPAKRYSAEAIATQLSHINRFNGSFGAYSVAQHCVHVAEQLPDSLKLSGLLHDVCEIWTGDIPSPNKHAIGGNAQSLEDHYCSEVDRLWGVTTRHALVKDADLRMLVTEASSFGCPLDHFPPVEPYGFVVRKWTPEQARAAFLAVYYALV